MISKQVPTIVGVWVKRIGDMSPSRMVELYRDNAILLATFEPILVGKESIHTYFVDFLDKKNMKCKILKNRTQSILPNHLIVSGIYVFSFTENGIGKMVEARYSFTIVDGKIANHHSSLMPTNK
jgi:hypothetical protein